VAGRHRRSDVSTQDPSFDDTAGSLDCDKQSNVHAIYDVRDIIAEENGFATRFVCTADSAPTAGKTDVGVMYFYRLGDSKVTGWRLLANTDFDYKARSTEEGFQPGNEPCYSHKRKETVSTFIGTVFLLGR
jgi:hypothetical protein